MAECLIAFGSNQGDSPSTFRHVSNSFQEATEFTLVAASIPQVTQPVGGPAGQPPFLNGVFRIHTPLTAVDLHRRLIELESSLGRKRRERWGARSVDLDLLLVDALIIDRADLVVPHPRMSFRRFVLEPASEIAAAMIHPTSGLAIGDLLNRINSSDNHLVWQTPNANRARSIVAKCDDILSDWTVSFSGEVSHFPRELPKLIIREDRSKTALTGAPVLDLEGCSPELMLVEIRAAIMAMA